MDSKQMDGGQPRMKSKASVSSSSSSPFAMSSSKQKASSSKQSQSKKGKAEEVHPPKRRRSEKDALLRREEPEKSIFTELKLPFQFNSVLARRLGLNVSSSSDGGASSSPSSSSSSSSAAAAAASSSSSSSASAPSGNNPLIPHPQGGNYVNADLRFFNLASLCRDGKFDAVLMDPPWRIQGAQYHQSNASMFSNSGFKLNYNTLSNEEIIQIRVEDLSDAGFLFLWVVQTSLPFGLKCMKKWGYEYIDTFTWVKTTSERTKVHISQGYYFLHSQEICLVGIKRPPRDRSDRDRRSVNTLVREVREKRAKMEELAKKEDESSKELLKALEEEPRFPTAKLGGLASRPHHSVQFISKITNNVIFADVRKKSRKPDEMYHIIEEMLPGGRYIELFARNHNLRREWISVGNQLGPNYEQNWVWNYACDRCGGVILPGTKRMKSRVVGGQDICGKCFETIGSPYGMYWTLQNLLDEQCFHEWHSCDVCRQNPINGALFQCTSCEEFECCEECLNSILNEEVFHIPGHEFDVIEYPTFGAGFTFHPDTRCAACHCLPIVGERFFCLECKISLCRTCFFTSDFASLAEIGGLDYLQKHVESHPVVLVYGTDLGKTSSAAEEKEAQRGEEDEDDGSEADEREEVAL